MLNKSNLKIKEAIDSGQYTVDENGVIYKNHKIMSQSLHKGSGRYRVRVNGRKIFSHRLIGYAKFGNWLFEKGMELHHINDDPTNNRPENLQLVDRDYHLRHLHAGEVNKSAVLTWRKVNKIRHLWKSGIHNYALIGRMFGVSGTTIKSIILNYMWKEDTYPTQKELDFS